jgi:hypothetical protein
MCPAHYQAHFMRKVPVDQLFSSEPHRLVDPVDVNTRIERADDMRLRKAIAAGKVKESRYSFLQRTITEAIRAL